MGGGEFGALRTDLDLGLFPGLPSFSVLFGRVEVPLLCLSPSYSFPLPFPPGDVGSKFQRNLSLVDVSTGLRRDSKKGGLPYTSKFTLLNPYIW